MTRVIGDPSPRLLAFAELVKPELTGLTVLTGIVAFLFAGGSPYDWPGVVWAGSAMFLVGGCAASWNQVLERSHDEQMRRTERRPIPSGRIGHGEAVLFGSLAGVGGIVLLWMRFGWLPAVLAVATLVLYLGVYTPLKRRTSWNTVIGAIPGALPTLIGWSAGEGSISAPGWIFFSILVFWQFPHFFALAWMYRPDYLRAGYRMLPLDDDIHGTRTNRYNILSIMTLILITSLLYFGHYAGSFYLAVGLLAGAGFLLVAWAVRAEQQRSDGTGIGRIPRKLFYASLLYLPIVLLSALLDRLPQ
jgi:protoheme IX farnesyltransferase